MSYTEDFGPEDISEKTFEVDNNVIRIRRVNPFGFCHISYERGTVPEHLKGAYTSYHEAEKAVLAYLESKPQKTVKAVN